MGDWQTLSVEELVKMGVIERPMDGNHGSIHPKSGDFVSSGIPFIMASDLKDGRVDFESCSFISEEQASLLRKGFAKSGDVLLSHKATIGRTAIVQENSYPFIMLTPQVTYYRVKDKSRLINRFLKYYFDSRQFKAVFEAWAGGGSTRAYLGITAQQKLPITVPLIEAQMEIIRLIGPLEDKIHLNKQMNETVEAMARAIFKDWFVDFGPVRAKVGGREPYLAPETWDLFPDTFDDEDKPMGWELGCLADVADSPRRGISPADVAEDTPYIGLEHMPRRSIALTEWEGAGKVTSNKSAFRSGEFLFGKLRPYFHKVGVAPLDGICSTDIVVVTPRAPDWAGFVLACMSSNEFVDYTDQTSTGTKMPRTSWKTMGQYKLCLPPETTARAFQSIVHPLIDRVIANIHENRTLAQTRDLLLPKLMSGEILLSEAEEAVGAVA